MRDRLFRVAVFFALSLFATTGYPPIAIGAPQDEARLTPAYQVLAAYAAGIKCDLKDLSTTLTSTNREVVEKRDQLDAIENEMGVIAAGNIPIIKLNSRVGKLFLRKAVIEAELKTLKRSFTSSHPLVISKRVQLDSLTQEIETILR